MTTPISSDHAYICGFQVLINMLAWHGIIQREFEEGRVACCVKTNEQLRIKNRRECLCFGGCHEHFRFKHISHDLLCVLNRTMTISL